MVSILASVGSLTDARSRRWQVPVASGPPFHLVADASCRSRSFRRGKPAATLALILVCADAGAVLHSGLRHVVGADAAILLNSRRGRRCRRWSALEPGRPALFIVMPRRAGAAEV